MKSLIDKLGVKEDSKVSLVGVFGKDFSIRLRERTTNVSDEKPRKASDLILLSVENKGTLKEIKRLKGYIKSDGALWVIRPKGKEQIKEWDVLSAGRAAGLVDITVVRFSLTHTAHKFVIPLTGR